MADLKKTAEILIAYADEVSNLYRQKLIDGGVVATGDLVNSVSTTVNISGSKAVVTLSLLDYWKNVEYGRAPGKFAPVDNITQWIRAKPVLPKENTSEQIPTEDQLCFLINRKIARDGIKERPFLAQTLEEVNQKYEQLIMEALQSDFNEDVNILIVEGLRDGKWNKVKFI